MSFTILNSCSVMSDCTDMRPFSVRLEGLVRQKLGKGRIGSQML